MSLISEVDLTTRLAKEVYKSKLFINATHAAYAELKPLHAAT